MLQANRFYIKTAIDLRLQRLAGGGEMHSDCEDLLLEKGSRQVDIATPTPMRDRLKSETFAQKDS